MTHWQPEGSPTISPYIVVKGAGDLLSFTSNVLGATERMKHEDDGVVMHAEVQIGDSVLMIADTCDIAPVRTAMLHVYVENCDEVYRQALIAGADSVQLPEDKFYGDRNAGVKDVWGNTWYFSTHVEDVSEEEMQARLKAGAHG